MVLLCLQFHKQTEIFDTKALWHEINALMAKGFLTLHGHVFPERALEDMERRELVNLDSGFTVFEATTHKCMRYQHQPGLLPWLTHQQLRNTLSLTPGGWGGEQEE